MLKKIRAGIAILLFTLITFYFLDFAGLLPDKFHWLAKIQFIPALLALNAVILGILLLATLLFGRIYCSVVCPLGIFQDVAARISRLFNKKKKKKRYKYRPAKNIWRWSILAVVAIAFFAGFTLLAALLDPYSAYGRIVSSVFKPVYVTGNNLLAKLFSAFDNYTFYKVDINIRSIFTFATGGITFLVIGFLGWKYGRIYCNTVCPVGTILGFLSKHALLRIKIDPGKCNKCGLCEMKCKALCLNSKEQKIDYSRCVVCFDCLDSCKHDALKLVPAFPAKKTEIAGNQSVDTGKRKFLATMAVSVLSIPAVYAQQKIKTLVSLKPYKRQTPLSPPGSASADHLLDHCTSCQLCISKCPSHVLKPAFMEYGLGGMMQPVMDFEKGFCNFDCTVCSDVCPSGALLPLTTEEKHRTQVGHVVFIKENCVVYTDETNCGACSEHCPTQAVSMVPYKNGLTIPSVNPAICVGCGGCEYICPVRPYRAIHVEGNEVHKQAEVIRETKKKEIEIDGFGF